MLSSHNHTGKRPSPLYRKGVLPLQEYRMHVHAQYSGVDEPCSLLIPKAVDLRYTEKAVLPLQQSVYYSKRRVEAVMRCHVHIMCSNCNSLMFYFRQKWIKFPLLLKVETHSPTFEQDCIQQ